MSRSKHTDPRPIRAARRLRERFQARSTGDLTIRRRCAQRLKELGLTTERNNKHRQPRHSGPRILIQMTSPGFFHPATKKDISNLLRAVGPLAVYGLRSVELVRAPSGGLPALVFGRYQASGRILLYQQPLPPWRLSGVLKREDARRLKRAGALIKLLPGSRATPIVWPDFSLKRFMIEEVLLHELGHHVLQHHKGKRPVRIARTKDHEAFAAQFVARHKSLVRAARSHPW